MSTEARADPTLVAEVAALLYEEAALLDARRFEAWLELYTEDAIYWIPQGEHQTDPVHEVSIVYDDRRRMYERVLRLSSGFAYSQDPPSRTCHVVGNVRVVGEEDAALQVASNLVVAEARRGVQQVYAGSVEHELVAGDAGYRIRRKTVRLITSDVPLGNVTFLI
jgi:3-phenylpropionate/cinnamic acid dioxygenase small subunit